jgi:hypothetical protein
MFDLHFYNLIKTLINNNNSNKSKRYSISCGVDINNIAKSINVNGIKKKVNRDVFLRNIRRKEVILKYEEYTTEYLQYFNI